MAPALDPERLPLALRPLVARALEDVDACEPAIEALEAELEARPTPDVLIALALLTHHEAAELVLSQLEDAAERALAWIDEALAMGAPRTEGLARLRRLCEVSLLRERTRLPRRRHALWPACDAAARARRAWMRGEDALALELARAADALAERIDNPPTRATG
jgi:hypothetical protein